MIYCTVALFNVGTNGLTYKMISEDWGVLAQIKRPLAKLCLRKKSLYKMIRRVEAKSFMVKSYCVGLSEGTVKKRHTKWSIAPSH